VPVPNGETFELELVPTVDTVQNPYNEYFYAVWSTDDFAGVTFDEVNFYTYWEDGERWEVLGPSSINRNPTLTALNGAQIITEPLESWPPFPY
jgi:hypothetical protein